MEMSEKKLVEQQIKIENNFTSGANWFFWIAGLSLVNSATSLSGSSMNFVIGLSTTQFIDAVASGIPGPYSTMFTMIAIMLDLGFAGLFFVFGILARRRSRAGFVLGMIFYGFDSLLLLLIGSIIGIVFHVLALVFIFTGLRALQKLEKQASAAPAPSPS